MARIAGVDLPNNKKVEISLTYIFGIGRSTASVIVKETGIDRNKKMSDLSDDEINQLREYIDKKLKIEGDLRTEINLNIKRLMEIGCYRGIRHRRNLPLRGQRTKTNAKTRKGRKSSIGSKKKVKR